MAFLDTYNETLPTGGQSVGGGDDIFRALATAVKNTMGVEHQLTGEHKFFYGNTANRPAAGHAGRIYLNTELRAVQYDNGASWYNAVNPLSAAFARQTVTATAQDTPAYGMGVSLVVGEQRTILGICSMDIIYTGTPPVGTVELTIVGDGGAEATQIVTPLQGVRVASVALLASTLFAGTYTIRPRVVNRNSGMTTSGAGYLLTLTF